MVTAVGEIQFNGVTYAIVDPGGAGGYVNGIYTRYLVVPMSSINKQIEDITVKESETTEIKV